LSVEECGKWLRGQLPYLQKLDLDTEKYFREFWDKKHNIRITYSFKSFADVIPLTVLQTISKSHQPDIVILNTGAWSNYQGLNPSRALVDMESFMEKLQNFYFGPLIYQNLITCSSQFRVWALKFNQLADRWFRSRNYPVLNRSSMTSPTEKNSVVIDNYCEGWHSWDFTVEESTSWLMNSFCERKLI